MSIIEELTARYGLPTVSRGVSRWRIVCKPGVAVSLIHGRGFYCSDTSVEVAYISSRGIVAPGSITTDPAVQGLYFRFVQHTGSDTVAGWCTLEDVQKIVAAAS